MQLREAFVQTESEILERRTKKAIDRIMIDPGVQSPDYEEKYESIMQSYRLRAEELRLLKFLP